MKAELVPENGDPPIPITRDLVIVGRRSYCDIVIDHSSLSKRHCVLVKTDGLLVIRDLISTNGTKVKGQKIRWAALLPDDRISLGSYKLRVYLGPDDAPGPSEIYRARASRGGSTSWTAAAGANSVEIMPAPLAAPALPGAPPGAPAFGAGLNRGFPEPSPLEIAVSSSEHEIALPAPGDRGHARPLLPIVLDDDDDDIIDLD